MRALWSGSIAFGLVNIPVKLFSATSENSLNFDMLHKKDLSPIRYARICKATGDEVPYEDIVKGYEYEKGEYVVITKEDFQNVSLEKSTQIAIEEFVKESEIDTIYFEKPYYLSPDKGAEHAFSLLRQALEKSKKVGLAKFVFHSREHLIIIKPFQDIIILNQLRFDEEIRDAKELASKSSTKATARELDMALTLIDQLTHHFVAKDYHDTYTDELKALIAKKTKGTVRHPKKAGVARHPTKVVDLFETLKASLKPAKKSRKAN